MKSIDYYSGVDLEFPIRPSKPGSFDRNDPQNIRDFADRMEAYLERDAEYRTEMVAYRETIKDRKNELCRDLGAQYNMNPAQAQLLFNKAWDDGHSAGIQEVVHNFDDLAQFVAAYVSIS